MGIPYAEVIGDPVAHSKSPIIHKFWLAKLGLDYDYRRTRVSPEQLPAYRRAARSDPLWRGANVTIPLKRAVVPYLDEVAYPVPRIGAVNTIVKKEAQSPALIGHNTDSAGFLEPLRGWPTDERNLRWAILIGTGGAAAAVAWALFQIEFTVFVYGRSVERAENLLRELDEEDMNFAQSLDTLAEPGADWSDRSDISQIVVNASPLGMTGCPPLAINLDGLPPDTIVYDLVYDPVETPLLKAAKERGMRTVSGLDMLVGQAAVAFELFFARPAPREHDGELMELLTR